jgi:hypothetical protein
LPDAVIGTTSEHASAMALAEANASVQLTPEES